MTDGFIRNIESSSFKDKIIPMAINETCLKFYHVPTIFMCRSRQGEKWITARGDKFLNKEMISKHCSLDILNDGMEIYKYRIMWGSGAWSEWYYPGINDNNWKAKSDHDNVWNKAHKDAGRRSWTLFADHYHQIYYITPNS